VRDELFGVLSDHKTMCNAKLWIDAQIEIANKMLTKVVGQHGED
jgi:hypothetical protein